MYILIYTRALRKLCQALWMAQALTQLWLIDSTPHSLTLATCRHKEGWAKREDHDIRLD
jgi:hypothetical protein